jgi:glutamyl/glutaminyl-tRNA synthetase
MGDPVVVRRDGAVAYHLAVVVDDHRSGVDRIVRGRDIGPSTATHVAIQRLLGWPSPRYLHHFLLLEPRADRKLAKFHGAVGADELMRHYRPAELCGLLAHVAGLRADVQPCMPTELVADFAWGRVRRDDCVLSWRGDRLEVGVPLDGVQSPAS